MLVLSRKEGETIVIDEEIEVVILRDERQQSESGCESTTACFYSTW